jgi:membrane protease subunit (stomatin/prohibitin family)
MLEFLKKQFVDVIEWLEEPGQLAWRVPFRDHEIQNGAKLTVREGQMAAFINEGVVADVFGPGLHTLTTQTLPVLTNLRNWDKAFKSPFKSDVVFYSQREQTGLKWGTTQPITVRDSELGPLRIRAFGSYSAQLEKVDVFSAQLLGTTMGMRIEDIEPQLRSAIVTAIATGIAGSGIAFLDLAANQQKLSDVIKAAVQVSFAQWGMKAPAFFVESLSLPEDVQAHLDKASSMRVLGDLSKYAQFQAAEAIPIAAEQSGGIAGVGAGIAAAAAIGGTMGTALGGNAGFGMGAGAGAGAAAASAAAPAEEDPFAVIEKLHKLVTIGALTQAEFDAKKAELLARVR